MYDYKDAVKAMMDVGHGLWVLMVFAVSLILLVISTVAGYIAQNFGNALGFIGMMLAAAVAVNAIILLAWLIV